MTERNSMSQISNRQEKALSNGFVVLMKLAGVLIFAVMVAALGAAGLALGLVVGLIFGVLKQKA